MLNDLKIRTLHKNESIFKCSTSHSTHFPHLNWLGCQTNLKIIFTTNSRLPSICSLKLFQSSYLWQWFFIFYSLKVKNIPATEIKLHALSFLHSQNIYHSQHRHDLHGLDGYALAQSERARNKLNRLSSFFTS